jgi:NhaC family Na+:H+ antiporter
VTRFRTSKPLTLCEALLPVASMLVLFAAGAASLSVSPELLIAVLLGSATVAGLVAARHGITWDEVQRSTGEKLASVLPALLILLSIGMLIATWILSGTIPFMVYWGVELVSPRYLVLTAFLATGLMSLFTGTSWGSAGTIGVALMGTAAALGTPLAVTAGAVVSGAYLGDKLSPLSDSTNICAIGAGAPLYTHIRHMLYTALPSTVAALIVYALVARLVPVTPDGVPDTARAVMTDIDTAFHLHPVVLLPPAIVVWSIVRKVPPALAIGLSSLAAALIGMVVQGFAIQDAIVAAVAGFRLDMVAPAEPQAAAVGAAFTTLVERGGLYSMANTLVVVIAAFLLAGAMDASGSRSGRSSDSSRPLWPAGRQ